MGPVGPRLDVGSAVPSPTLVSASASTLSSPVRFIDIVSTPGASDRFRALDAESFVAISRRGLDATYLSAPLPSSTGVRVEAPMSAFHDFSMCSRVRPLVSGRNFQVTHAARKQQPA
jgi:hypothetical protein